MSLYHEKLFFLIKHFKCHIHQISEESENHYLLHIPDLVAYFRLTLETYRRLVPVINYIRTYD